MHLNLSNINTSKKNAVATSGGVDSLALCFLLKEKGIKFTSLIVDHKYRKNSTEEALAVKSLLQENNIDAEILTYSGKAPQKNIEEALRKARYKLILKHCRKNNINQLLTAHHLDDNIETFLMKLSKGAGVNGLSAMQHQADIEGVNIFRPLLQTTKQELINYLKAKKIKHFEDETNSDSKFTRNKLRNILSELEGYDVIRKNISHTISALSNTASYIDSQTKNAFKKTVKINQIGFLELNIKKFQKLHSLIAIDMIKQTISGLQFNDKNIRQIEADQLYNNILAQKKSFTFAGVEFFLYEGNYLIFKELSRQKQEMFKENKLIWDKNFHIEIRNLKNISSIKIKPLGKNYKEVKNILQNIPNKILQTLPEIHIKHNLENNTKNIANSVLLPHIENVENLSFKYKFQLNNKVF